MGGGTPVRVASVATAFPSGQAPLRTRLAEVKAAVADGADEIDMVINRNAFLSGRVATVGEEIAAVLEACGAARLKVILETGELDGYDQIRAASFLAMRADCGRVILSRQARARLQQREPGEHAGDAGSDPGSLLATGVAIGMKPAGGIGPPSWRCIFWSLVKETLGDAWLTNVRYRFGASALLNDLLRQIEKERTGAYRQGTFSRKRRGRTDLPEDQ